MEALRLNPDDGRSERSPSIRTAKFLVSVEMKYALLIYEAPGSLEALPEGQYEAMFAEYMALSKESRFLNGARLQPVETATTVRVRDGKTLTTDGPFADAKEVFGGFCEFEVDSLDEAIALAERIPAGRVGGAIELRPLVED
jgi:hypothetical protein